MAACRYIKELADRLNTLENSISTGDHHVYGLSGEGDLSPGPSDSTSPPPGGGSAGSARKTSRKRALSSSSDFQLGVHLQPLSQTNATPRASERLPSIDSFHPATHQQHQQRSQLLQHESQRQLPPRPPPVRQQPNQQPPPGSASDNPQLGHHTSLTTDGTRHYWQGYADMPNLSGGGYQYDIDPHRPPAKPSTAEISTFDWDEEAIDQ